MCRAFFPALRFCLARWWVDLHSASATADAAGPWREWRWSRSRNTVRGSKGCSGESLCSAWLLEELAHYYRPWGPVVSPPVASHTPTHTLMMLMDELSRARTRCSVIEETEAVEVFFTRCGYERPGTVFYPFLHTPFAWNTGALETANACGCKSQET